MKWLRARDAFRLLQKHRKEFEWARVLPGGGFWHADCQGLRWLPNEPFCYIAGVVVR